MKYSDFRYFLEIALVITPIISVVIMVLLLVIHIIRTARRFPNHRFGRLSEPRNICSPLCGERLSPICENSVLTTYIISLKRFKEPEERRFKLCEINLGITVSALAAAVILIGFYGIYNQILRAAFCIAATVFLAIMLTMVVFCLRRRLKKTVDPVLILECVCCFFITVSFIYWRIYRFWGF